MSMGHIFGQWFRDATGMPSKASTYDARLAPYKDIVECVEKLKESVIQYFSETHYSKWGIIQAQKELFHGQLLNGVLTAGDYDVKMTQLGFEEEAVIGGFIEKSDEYFVVGCKRRLATIISRHKNDQYIGLMNISTWDEIKEAYELSKVVIASIQNCDDYIDSKRIEQISDKFKYERHLRRGR